MRSARNLIACALLTGALLLSACAPRQAATPLSPDDTVRAAQLVLTDRCLTRQGLTPPRPGQQKPSAAEQRRVVRALFGAGRAELAVRLPSGHTVRRHTDGCLAAAQSRLYGDLPRWFEVSATVGNLRSKAPRGDRIAYEALRAEGLKNAKAVLNSTIRKGT